MKDLKNRKDLKGIKHLKNMKDHKAMKDLKEHKDVKDVKDLKELKDILVLKDMKDLTQNVICCIPSFHTNPPPDKHTPFWAKIWDSNYNAPNTPPPPLFSYHIFVDYIKKSWIWK